MIERMTPNDYETQTRDRNEIADILTKAVVRHLTQPTVKNSQPNSPNSSHVGLSSSRNDRSL
jgi:hypothetical protein